MTAPVLEEIKAEIAARLGVRRRFFRWVFLLYSIAVLGVMLPTAWMNPDLSLYILSAAGSAIFGTGVVLWWAYVVRKSTLYERAGKRLLGNA